MKGNSLCYPVVFLASFDFRGMLACKTSWEVFPSLNFFLFYFILFLEKRRIGVSHFNIFVGGAGK